MASRDNRLHDILFSGSFCDFTFCVGDEKIRIHKVVMSVCSDYCQMLFTKEPGDSTTIDNLESVDTTGLQAIVNFVYGGDVYLNGDNIYSILKTACCLKIQTGIDACVKYLTSEITIANCVDIYNLAEFFSLKEMLETVKSFILFYFMNILVSQLSVFSTSQLSVFLKDDSLRIMSEIDLLDILDTWLENNTEISKADISELVSLIRLEMLSYDQLHVCGTSFNFIQDHHMVDVRKYKKSIEDAHTLLKNYHESVRIKWDTDYDPAKIGNGSFHVFKDTHVKSARGPAITSDASAMSTESGLPVVGLSQDLCDFLLCVEDEEIPVHRLVMSAVSEYLRTLFKYKETSATIDELDSVGLRAVVDFVYGKEVTLNGDNIHSVLEAANYLQVQTAVDVCTTYLTDEITISNCVDIYHLSDLFSIQTTLNVTKSCILYYFMDILTSQLILLSCSQLCAIFADDNLRVMSEMQLLEVLNTWSESNPDTSESEFAELFTKIRLEFLQDEQILSCESKFDFMRENTLCVARVNKVKEQKNLVSTAAEITTNNQNMERVTKWVDAYDQTKIGVGFHSFTDQNINSGFHSPIKTTPTTLVTKSTDISLDVIQKQTNLYDFTLCADEEQIPVHKLLMSAKSEYCRTLFKYTEGKDSATIEELDAIGLRVVLDYVYGKEVIVNGDNIYAVLKAAHYLQIPAAIDTCQKYLSSEITNTNCVDIYHLADMFSMQETLNLVKLCILHYFSEIVPSQFSILTSVQLSAILSDNNLRVQSETDLVEKLNAWIEVNQEVTREEIAELLRKIRLELLSVEQINVCASFEFMPRNELCMLRIDQVRKYKQYIEDARLLVRTQEQRVRTTNWEKVYEPTAVESSKLYTQFQLRDTKRPSPINISKRLMVQPDHKLMLDALNHLRLTETFCDFTLICDNQHFLTHKVVLAASSNYMKVFFVDNGNDQSEIHFTMDVLDSFGLKTMVDYIYGGNFQLNVDNINSVMKAANYLRIKGALKICRQYLQCELTRSNCVDIYNGAELLQVPEVTYRANIFIQDNFLFISQTQLCRLTHRHLSSILADDSVKVDSEYKLLEMIQRWILVNDDVTDEMVAELVSHVKLCLLSGDVLVEKVATLPFMEHNEVCKAMLDEAKGHHG